MTRSLACDRDWLRKLVNAINATTNPPLAAGGEPDGARALFSHDALRVPSGDQSEFLKQARAL